VLAGGHGQFGPHHVEGHAEKARRRLEQLFGSAEVGRGLDGPTLSCGQQRRGEPGRDIGEPAGGGA
jgi:hypothetical protein